ncbi:MAG: ABC transporter permease subunit [Actinobacteria bacterium]|uniref:Unannotated protein n=1 Tax=freshwater metagenome TaxID=449393 RepID=A0A6J7TDB5_9ZZZZ|nr:carbohydrate ABC transporter permease [Actinomycetota bacterium]MSW47034.1 ABC transporter permease subunit [Actinomycetota bacterium]MSX25073.1 ABC transporter permease subunit [Actinomycetota bacterium]MSY46329.1 ABC transporter permease subunit [Actinomycetota bacterium]MSY56906.1 ABC transporter permease subunit [Actinomycetota bacterium]
MIRRRFLHALIGAYSLFALLPLFWMFYSSFKSNAEISQTPLSLPHSFDFRVFVDSWRVGGVGKYALNSVIATTASTVLVLVTASMAGFALSRLRFPGSRAVFLLFTLGLLLPIQSYFIMQNQEFDYLNLKDTRWALIIPYTAMGIPLAIWLIKSYIDSLPKELFEAARIDGSSDIQTYRFLMFPIIRPALVTVGIFSALGAWNEFLLALLYVQDESLKTIPTGLLSFSSKYATDYRMLFAALTMVTVPMIALYVGFNRQIVAGITQGAVKG